MSRMVEGDKPFGWYPEVGRRAISVLITHFSELSPGVPEAGKTSAYVAVIVLKEVGNGD